MFKCIAPIRNGEQNLPLVWPMLNPVAWSWQIETRRGRLQKIQHLDGSWQYLRDLTYADPWTDSSPSCERLLVLYRRLNLADLYHINPHRTCHRLWHRRSFNQYHESIPLATPSNEHYVFISSTTWAHNYVLRSVATSYPELVWNCCQIRVPWAAVIPYVMRTLGWHPSPC